MILDRYNSTASSAGFLIDPGHLSAYPKTLAVRRPLTAARMHQCITRTHGCCTHTHKPIMDSANASPAHTKPTDFFSISKPSHEHRCITREHP